MDQSLPTTIVIFGASGDLAHRKLIPALFSLYRKGRLPVDFEILGLAGRGWDDDKYKQEMSAAVTSFADFPFEQTEWEAFSSRLHYLSGNFHASDSFDRLAGYLAELENGPANRLFYLATLPELFAEIVSALGARGLVAEDSRVNTGGWRRVVIEKPFGADYNSARQLNASLYRVLDERQIYRIDHYLGKESVQNLLVFRFANILFEPIWNCNYIDHVQITVAEKVGVENRAGYYDQAGVVRDMFQNHLLQLLSLVAMEPPASPNAKALRDEKMKVLEAMRPIRPEEVAKTTLRGQYRGYQEEPGVAHGSRTPTYAAMRFYIDNWRWAGVPFFLRSGKRLAEKCTEIIIRFKRPPLPMFPHEAARTISRNMIALCLQPDEGIHQRFEAKVPDTRAETRSVDMLFHYRTSFGPMSIPDAYERLLLDALQGDPSLFTRGDRSELAWRLLDPILQTWEEQNVPPLHIYEPGSWGPEEAGRMLAGENRTWLRACGGH